MNLILYDLSLNKIGDLITDGDTSARHIGESVSYGEIDRITFEIRKNSNHFSNVINGNMLLYNDQFYVITEITSIDSVSSSQNYNVVAVHNAKQLKDRLIADGEELIAMNIEQILTLFLYDNLVPIYNWEVGTVVADLNKYRTYTPKEMSVFEALIEIAELYDLYVFFDSGLSGNFINLYDKDTYRSEVAPLTLFESINIKEINIVRNMDEFATRLYAFGGTDPATSFDVDIIDATVNGSPWGKTYVENYSYYLDLGYTQEYISANPDLFLKEAVWRDSNYVDPDTLYADAVVKLSKISSPKIDVTLSVLMTNIDGTKMSLSQYPKLGYKINIVDTRLQEEIIFTVVGYEINYDTPWEIGLSATNVVIRKNALLDIVRSAQTMRRITKADGTVKPIYVDSNIDEQLSAYDIAVQQLNELAINATGFYQTIYTDPITDAKTDYMHDNPVLSLSNIIYMKTATGFFWTDTGWNDGNPTWMNGYTASGNIVAKTLSVVGINADWITTGSVTSSNYEYTSGSFSNAGTKFDLTNGSIISKNFFIGISGNVKFNSGTIGGFTFTPTQISGGDLRLHVDGSISVSPEYSSWSFYVDNVGKLTATGPTFSKVSGCSFNSSETTKFDTSGNLTVGGTSSFKGNMSCTGTSTFGASNNVTISSIGAVTISSGSFKVGGASSYCTISTLGEINTTGTLTVGSTFKVGDVSNYCTISSLGNINTTGTLTAEGNFKVGDYDDYCTISSLGAINTTNSLTVKGNSTLNGFTNTIANALKHTGSTLGFFNAIPTIKTTVLAPSVITTTGTADATYSSNEQTMLGNLKTDVTNLRSKLNEIWDALDGYGLI